MGRICWYKLLLKYRGRLPISECISITVKFFTLNHTLKGIGSRTKGDWHVRHESIEAEYRETDRFSGS